MEKSITKITKWVLVFLSIFVPFRDFIAFYTISYIKFLPDIMIWVLFAFVIIKNKFKLNLKIYDILYIAFLIFGFMSSLLNKTSILAYCLQFRSITTMYILFYILRNIKMEKKDFKPFIITLMITTTLLIILAVGEILTNKCLFFPESWALSINYESNFVRAYSLINNPNTFAIVIFMTMLIAFYSEKELNYKVPFLYYLLVFLGILTSASRSTLIVIALFFLFLIFESIKHRKARTLIYMLLLFGIAFGINIGINKLTNKINYTCYIQTVDTYKDKDEMTPPASTEQPSQDNKPNVSTPNETVPTNSGIPLIDRWLETLTGETIKNSVVNGRVFIIKKGIEIFSDYPIYGTGFGTFGSAASRMVTPKLYERYNLYEKIYSDNDYIKILVETGLIGTLLYGAFIISLIIYSFKNKYKFIMYMSYLIIGLFYNVSELQVMCLILYVSFILFDKNKELNI